MVDGKGYGADGKGFNVDAKGYAVDGKGYTCAHFLCGFGALLLDDREAVQILPRLLCLSLLEST
eukprot:2997540-Pyramimonas_sp.AAC.1